MTSSPLQKLRTYLHLVPVFGIVLSLWTLYGKAPVSVEEPEDALADVQIQSVSRLSVLIGVGCISAIALLGLGASSQAQATSLRFLLTLSFIGSGYFLLNLILMFRVAKGRSIRLPGISQLSRRLP
ncbi:MAG: hypothetical protein WBC73_17050 [Phormidesmis sp.]